VVKNLPLPQILLYLQVRKLLKAIAQHFYACIRIKRARGIADLFKKSFKIWFKSKVYFGALDLTV